MSFFTEYNPVTTVFGVGARSRVVDIVGDRRAVFILSRGAHNREVLESQLAVMGTECRRLVVKVENPDFADIAPIYEQVWQAGGPQVIVAVGGGSVIDLAKACAIKENAFAALESKIRQGGPYHTRLPLVAIPTTAGTGSEVTPFATIWDHKERKKYSLSGDLVFPEWALCDPELLLSLPKEVTLQTALDALSHCLESIWNRNRDPQSVEFAVHGASCIVSALPACLEDPTNLEWRSKLMEGSLSGGLAISRTKTALAHGISYYLTLHKGTAHGRACSFSLPAIVSSVYGEDELVDDSLRRIFGDDPPTGIQSFFEDLGIPTRMSDYGITAGDLEQIKLEIVGNPRVGNFLFDAGQVVERLER